MYTLTQRLKSVRRASVVSLRVCYGAQVDEASGGKPRKPGKTTSKKNKTSEDKILIHGVSEDGEKLSVLRARRSRRGRRGLEGQRR
jgi:hypothetical protein